MKLSDDSYSFNGVAQLPSELPNGEAASDTLDCIAQFFIRGHAEVVSQ